MKLLILTFLSVIYHCNAYSAGAPEAVCDDMTPKHPVDPQKTPMPYKVALSKNQVKAGENVEIEINGADQYKGVLVQVRNGGKAVGEFIVPDNDRYYKTITCHNNKNSAVTHKNANDKIKQKLVWKSPSTKGKYTVYVTVAKDGGTFWAQKPTEVISVF